MKNVEKETKKHALNEQLENYIKKTMHKDFAKIEACRILLITVLAIPWCIFIFIVLFLLILCIYNQAIAGFGPILGFSIPIYIGLYLFSQWIIKIFKRNTKKIFLSKLLSYIGEFEVVNTKEDKNNLNSYISSLKLFPPFNIFESDDMFTGKYNGIQVDISEICIKQKEFKDSLLIFNGLLLTIPANKECDGQIIFREKGFCHIGINGLKKIKLESPEIEQKYDIFASDNIEARKILTPAFLVRLLELSNNLKTKIFVSFEQNKINIAIQTKKDMFEMPFLSSTYNIENYKNILSENIKVLSVIDTLHLDENIGM